MSLIPRLSDLLDGSVNTTTCKNIDLQNKTSDELIQVIRTHMAELHCRGLIFNQVNFHDHQLATIKSLEEWHSENNNSLNSIIQLDSIPFEKHSHACIGEHIPAPDLSEREQFDKASKFILRSMITWSSMKDTIHDYITPFMEQLRTQSRIIELENILLKHPNRSYVKAELIKLKKTIKPKIGRKKKRK